MPNLKFGTVAENGTFQGASNAVDMTTMTLPEKVKLLMDRQGMIAADLARRAIMSPARITGTLNGEYKATGKSGMRIAQALGVTYDYLHDDKQTEPPLVLTDKERVVFHAIRTLGVDPDKVLDAVFMIHAGKNLPTAAADEPGEGKSPPRKAKRG